MTASAGTPPPLDRHSLFFIADRSTGVRFLVDTGAAVSVLPATPAYRPPAYFCAPLTVTTDRGGQFCSSLFTNLLRSLGTIHHTTTAYHLSSHGMVERFHRTLKSALMATDTPPLWFERLPLVLLGIRTAFKEDMGCSPAEMVYGTPLRLPSELVASPSHSSGLVPQLFVDRLRHAMRALRPSPPRCPSARPEYSPPGLGT
ncbi:uncharacterized protein LOC135372071 [Ornithodoros turicata]|uniref:uncharacterized protein LOC135372071 n=1 Tax=Ornithodoros turicata TaxID=34597 RepID=UPI00313A40FE